MGNDRGGMRARYWAGGGEALVTSYLGAVNTLFVYYWRLGPSTWQPGNRSRRTALAVLPAVLKYTHSFGSCADEFVEVTDRDGAAPARNPTTGVDSVITYARKCAAAITSPLSRRSDYVPPLQYPVPFLNPPSPPPPRPSEQVAPRLEPAYSKMLFVSTWAAFACSLFWLNRLHGRRVFQAVPAWEQGVLWKLSLPFPVRGATRTISVNWKACVLIMCGFVGGVFSAISGR